MGLVGAAKCARRRLKRRRGAFRRKRVGSGLPCEQKFTFNVTDEIHRNIPDRIRIGGRSSAKVGGEIGGQSKLPAFTNALLVHQQYNFYSFSFAYVENVIQVEEVHDSGNQKGV